MGIARNGMLPFALCMAFIAHGAENAGGDPVKEFTKRVGEYVKLHQRLEKELPPLKGKNDAAEIAAHKDLLARKLQEARRDARHGDILFPGVQPHFRSIIQSEFRGRQGATARETIKEGNPKIEGNPQKVVLRVNAKYPDDAPVSTVPPGLLLRLPSLPEEVEYRFVGRYLIIHDAKANLIVDFLPDTAPAS